MPATGEMLKFQVQLGEFAAGYLKQMFSGATDAEGLQKCIASPVGDECSSQVVVAPIGRQPDSFSVVLPREAFDRSAMGEGIECNGRESEREALSRHITKWVNTARNVLFHPQEYAVKVEYVALTAAP